MSDKILLNDQERLDTVNDGLKLIQRTTGLTFGTDALLLASFINEKEKISAELGAGTGIISFLLLQRNKASKVYAYEIQDGFCSLIKRNAELNGLSDRITVHSMDIRTAKASDNGSELDVVFSNPPYMKKGAGLCCEQSEKDIARREICGTVNDFCASAKRLLKHGGRFYTVYRPDRLSTLLYAQKNASLEPKRITLVYPDAFSSPSLVLVMSRLGAGEELKITRPLIIYKDQTHTDYTDDMMYIYNNGSFPEDYYR